MDPLLTLRYQTLFQYYGIGGNNLLLDTKSYLTSRINQDPQLLRPDAALFLLVNIEHMIIRPLSGYIPDPMSPHGSPMRVSMDPLKLNGALKQFIDIILNDLQLAPKPATAHSVLKSVDKYWAQIGKLFDWY
jgi:hypothetical protein